MQEEEGDGSYGESYWNDSCGYNVHEANDGYNRYYHGDDGYEEYNSEGKYACANIENYNEGSCGYTNQYGRYDDNYGGSHCRSEYDGYYNGYVGTETDGDETNYPPTEDDERCGIAVTTSDMATILEEKLKEKEKQLKLAKVAKRLDRLTKAVKHLAERTQVSPKIHCKNFYQ